MLYKTMIYARTFVNKEKRVRHLIPVLGLLLGVFRAVPANSHASERGLVLLLPTDLYISAGLTAVVLTVLALALTPQRFSARVFSTVVLPGIRQPRVLATACSLISFALFVVLIGIGLEGPRDPLANPLTLFVWTVWWVAFVVIQGLFGDLWRFVNPWTGLYELLFGSNGRNPIFDLPKYLAAWPGVATFLAFSAFALADPAPDDPARLASVAGSYWMFTFFGMVIFGREQWLSRCECFTMLLAYIARLSPLRLGSRHSLLGLPGWAIYSAPSASISQSVFVLTVLAVGSFDGLNETFWWLDLISVNPLEFPGRSAIISETVVGLIAASVLLVLVVAACVLIGLRFAGQRSVRVNSPRFRKSFGRLAHSILPIALAYHFAHYLTSFLVNGQYALASATDPLATGADYLGLGTYYVTTGFFNTLDSVRNIWLTQCTAIVFGHIVAVLLAHTMAIDLYGEGRRAAASQIPLAGLMVCYTFLSLWLLSSPRGA